jgi:hypothetical protein
MAAGLMASDGDLESQVDVRGVHGWCACSALDNEIH